MKNTHFAENPIILPPLGRVWWVLKGHMKGKATNYSTCAILFQRMRNVSVKSEALVPSRFVTKTTFQHWRYFILVCNRPPWST